MSTIAVMLSHDGQEACAKALYALDRYIFLLDDQVSDGVQRMKRGCELEGNVSDHVRLCVTDVRGCVDSQLTNIRTRVRQLKEILDVEEDEEQFRSR